MARKYHRMTPARRAALRKAQIASAKKRKRERRRTIAKRTGVAVGVFLGAVGTKQLNKLANSPGAYVKRRRKDINDLRRRAKNYSNKRKQKKNRKLKALPAPYRIQSGPWV